MLYSLRQKKRLDFTLKVVSGDMRFIVEDPLTQYLIVKIYDDEKFQSAELIRCAHICLNKLEHGNVKDIWLMLVNDLEIQRDQKNRCQVHLELLYCPNCMNDGDRLHEMLMLKVWNHDTFGKDFMGKCILTLTRVIMEGEYKDSYE
uniref:C2 domain-containing protein n=1 Tax=Solanum lycopersicum TaxID=4081 RepID=K4AU46_SOLLC